MANGIPDKQVRPKLQKPEFTVELSTLLFTFYPLTSRFIRMLTPRLLTPKTQPVAPLYD